jgi:hypothetical protein
MERFLYTAFGLTLASELELPELLPASDPPSVFIRRGFVPSSIPRATIRDAWYQLLSDDVVAVSLQGSTPLAWLSGENVAGAGWLE